MVVGTNEYKNLFFVHIRAFMNVIKLKEHDPQKKYMVIYKGSNVCLCVCPCVCVNNTRCVCVWMYVVVNKRRRADHYRINLWGMVWNHQSAVVFLSTSFYQ